MSGVNSGTSRGASSTITRGGPSSARDSAARTGTGTGAYFDLVGGRADLRPVLAASRNVIVMVGTNRALLVADDEGLEEFSDAQREQFGLVNR